MGDATHGDGGGTTTAPPGVCESLFAPFWWPS